MHGNWHPPIPLRPVEIGIVLVESNLMSHSENHQSAHITVAPLLLGVYLKIIIKKKGKAIHEGVLGVLFSNGENCNCIN